MCEFHVCASQECIDNVVCLAFLIFSYFHDVNIFHFFHFFMFFIFLFFHFLHFSFFFHFLSHFFVFPFFPFCFFSFLISSIFSFPPPSPRALPETSLFSFKNHNFKAPFWVREEERRKKKKEEEEERGTRRPKQVPFHNRTHKNFLLFACVETPHSDWEAQCFSKDLWFFKEPAPPPCTITR